MIYPDTIVRVLDIKSQKCQSIQISTLYAECATSHEMFPPLPTDGSSTIRITPGMYEDPVYIQDLNGWTEITSIRKVREIDYNVDWFTLTVFSRETSFKDLEVVLDSNAVIPVFDVKRMKIGFHGERKYQYTLKRLASLRYDDMLRVIDDGHLVFGSLRQSLMEKRIYSTGYEVYTKSGFFNAGGLYLWGREFIPDSVCVVCPDYQTDKCCKCNQ